MARQRLQRVGAGPEGLRRRSRSRVSRKQPPSASSGANAIACRTPSSAPQRESSSAATRGQVVLVVDVELEHVGRLAAAGWRRARSAAGRGRSRSATTSAPASCASRATAKAMLRRVITPVISRRLPSSIKSAPRRRPAARAPARRRSRARPAPRRRDLAAARAPRSSPARPACPRRRGPRAPARPGRGRRRAGAATATSASAWIVVADRDRALEDDAAQPAQRDHPLGIDRQQPDRVGEDQHPVRDPLAERALGGPVRVGVLRDASRRSGPRTRPGRPR